MRRIVALDAGPLGLASQASRPDRAEPDRCRAWLALLDAAGVEVIIPEIADYEVRRSLIRLGATAGIRRLDALKARYYFLPIHSAAMLRAAELWAALRLRGLPTAGPKSLDADAILAAQALAAAGPGDALTVASDNARHLARFPGVVARDWTAIIP
jgi:predicted nucleic acid-binding protein